MTDLDQMIRSLPKPLTVSVVRSEFGDREMTEIRPSQDVTASGRQQAVTNRARRRQGHASRVRALRAAGLRVPRIAAEVGLSERYVRRLLTGK